MIASRPLILLLIVTILTVLVSSHGSVIRADEAEGDDKEQEDALRRFSTKLLLTFENRPAGEHRLEIEEIYDQDKGLAKIVILNGAKAERAELFFRPEDELFLEMVYNLAPASANQPAASCRASVGSQQLPDGEFYYLKLLQELTRGAERAWFNVLLGPSVFLHAAQTDLLARYQQRSSTLEQNAKTEPIERMDLAATVMRRRFIVEKEVGFVKELPSFGEGAKARLEFSQADYMIQRAPLLAQLAAYFTYAHPETGLKYSVDYLEIDNLTLSHLAELHLDVFKLPQVRACLEAESAAQFGFDSFWSKSFQVRASRFSMNVHAHQLHPAGIHVAADTDRHLMRFDIDKRSRNVIDLKYEFIYHMPNEPIDSSASENSVLANHQQATTGLSSNVANDRCTIISSRSFPGLKAMNRAELILLSSHVSANRWAHLIGRPASIIYLGMGQLEAGSGKRAHEFELSYLSTDHLPPFFVLLFGKERWRQQRQSGAGEAHKVLLIGRLWLLAGASSCPPPAYTHRPIGCVDPIPLKMQLDQVETSETGPKVLSSEQVYFTEFEWELFEEDDVGSMDRSYETFDRRPCPVEQMELQLDVEWKEETPAESYNQPGEDPCQDRGQLDDLVFGQLNELILTYASFDVELMDLKRKQTPPGTMMATYFITLAELPDLANMFEQIASRVPQSTAKDSLLLAKSSDFKVLFECLTWASQFGNSLGVLHSPNLGCFVYDKLRSIPAADQDGKSSSANTATAAGNRHDNSTIGDGELFTAYSRRVESFIQATRNNLSGLKLFKTQHIDTVNHEIVRSNRGENSLEACLSRPSAGMSIVRDIKFSKLRQLSAAAAAAQNIVAHRQVPVKAGFRFVESVGGEQNLVKSRRQFEVVSLSDCLARCRELAECSSYSHCKNIQSRHEYCQLSDLMLSSKISPTSANEKTKEGTAPESGRKDSLFVRQSGCQVHSKDYLRYFEPARDAAELVGPSVKLDQWRSMGAGVSEFECASLCHQAGPSCMRFLHCRSDACYHRNVPPNPSGDAKNSDESSTGTLRVFEPSECRLFKKRSLSLYRRTVSTDRGPFKWVLSEPDGSRKLDDDDDETKAELRAETIAGAVSEEKCAQLCTENVECQSFDSCSTPIYSPTSDSSSSGAGGISLKRSLPHFVCTLLSHSLANNGAGRHLLVASERADDGNKEEDQAITTTLDRRSVELSSHCSHFERQGLGSDDDNAESAGELIIEMFKGNRSSSSPSRRLEPSADAKAIGLFSAALLGLTLGLAANMLAAFLVAKRRTQTRDSE